MDAQPNYRYRKFSAENEKRRLRTRLRFFVSKSERQRRKILKASRLFPRHQLQF
jgi:hypothetical protein